MRGWKRRMRCSGQVLNDNPQDGREPSAGRQPSAASQRAPGEYYSHRWRSFQLPSWRSSRSRTADFGRRISGSSWSGSMFMTMEIRIRGPKEALARGLEDLRNRPGASCPVLFKSGVPTGIRTPVYAVRGRRPGPLDDGDTSAGRSGVFSASGGVKQGRWRKPADGRAIGPKAGERPRLECLGARAAL